MVRSRYVTLSLLVLLVAGCTGAPSTGTSDRTATPTSTTTTTTTASTPPTTSGHYRRYEFAATRITETTAARELARTPSAVETDVTWRAAAFASALFDDGRATRVVVADANPSATPGPFENGTLVRDDGTFYELETRVVGRHEGRVYRIRLHGPLRGGSEAYARADGEAVNASALSAADRRVFTFALPSPDERASGVTSAGYRWVVPPGDDPADARLVDGTHYVRYEGGLYRIEGEPTDDRAVRYRIQYDLRPVAESASAFAETRLDAFVTAVGNDSVSAPADRVVDAALSGERVTWTGEREPPERYPAAEEWVVAHPPEGRTAYVRFDGSLYRLTVSKAVS
ncbi:MAG: hypothetical protein ABEJ82_07560 [Haloplanus sp.]